MTPNLLSDLINNPKIDKLAKKSKSARKSIKKLQRKLKMARKTNRLTDLRMLLGMAQVALSKAELLANIK